MGGAVLPGCRCRRVRLDLQAAAGISYAFQWGELNALWRYLGYDLKPGRSLEDLKFNGPLIGATFRW